jgi:hypothetical protein
MKIFKKGSAAWRYFQQLTYFAECALPFESPYVSVPKFGIPKTHSKFTVSSHYRELLARVQASW